LRNHCLAPSGLFALALASIICGGCAGNTRPAAAFASGLPAAPANGQVHELERLMFERVNRDRGERGLPALRFDPALCDIARSHSLDMHEHHFFEHESPRFGLLAERLDRAGYLYLTARENLAEAPTLDVAEDGLLRSPHHYENLMARDVTRIGIGIVKGGVADPANLTVTQVFTTPGKKENLAEARQNIAAQLRQSLAKKTPTPAREHPRLQHLAEEQLAALSGEPDAAKLQSLGSVVSAQLVKQPIAGVRGIAVSAQVVLDSSQFSLDVAQFPAGTRYYGLAVDKAGPKGTSPRVRVLLLLGVP
jgi:uncharacterized protein YkwD